MTSAVEEAIRCFEQSAGLPVVVHDLRHRWWSELEQQRYRHHQPLCRRVKAGSSWRSCEDFELRDFRPEAERWREGRAHRCHAGLVELAQPVFDSQGLLAVLFAGPFEMADDALLDRVEPPSAAFIRDRGVLPQVAHVDLPRRREQLRQLASRLRYIDEERRWLQPGASRRQRIERFLEDHHAEPLQLVDLAIELELGVERCRHAVRECCGRGFTALLRATRLRAACALLLNTELPVAEVAARCGLVDPSGFTRAFRAAFGSSPGRWRRVHRG